MKLIRASINNFRLLKDLQLDFSTEVERNLTVIRAANETGKTTCKTALLWGLFGNLALPGVGKQFPLFPSDMKEKLDKVEVSVEIEFETDQVVTVGRSAHELQTRRYRLLRSCVEYASEGDSIRREVETVVLFEVKPEGAKRVLDSDVASIIEGSIPLALKDVYFTDGDSAMSFIEAAATKGTKRKRVSAAIEALLGLEVLRKTAKHLGTSAQKFGGMIDDTNYAVELEKYGDRISGFEDDIAEWDEQRIKLAAEIAEGASRLASNRKKIEEALKLGDEAQLADAIAKCTRRIKTNKDSSERALGDISMLLNSSHLSAAMISKPAQRGLELLNELSKSNQLPKVNIPILEELLDRDNCFCGADLKKDTPVGDVARNSIAQAIEKSRAADALQEAATSLFYSVRSEDFGTVRSEEWIENYSGRSRDFSEFSAALSVDQKTLIKLIAERDAIDDTSLNELRELESMLSSRLDSARVEHGTKENFISEARIKLKEGEEDRRKIEKRLNKTDSSAEKLQLARLTQTIFSSICERLVKEELRKVSDEMNRIFLEMIGSDPEANDLTLITKAELTEDYDILVYGPNGHTLNPDQDLNGASRRAITLAFILALTKVSEVEAPNVIDTPLGMMSGFVKRSVLRRTVTEGSQVILFLTHDEIAGVESIIDETAGKTYTLTNPAHYPRMLVHAPEAKDARVVRCECDHHTHCPICERSVNELAA